MKSTNIDCRSCSHCVYGPRDRKATNHRSHFRKICSSAYDGNTRYLWILTDKYPPPLLRLRRYYDGSPLSAAAFLRRQTMNNESTLGTVWDRLMSAADNTLTIVDNTAMAGVHLSAAARTHAQNVEVGAQIKGNIRAQELRLSLPPVE